MTRFKQLACHVVQHVVAPQKPQVPFSVQKTSELRKVNMAAPGHPATHTNQSPPGAAQYPTLNQQQQPHVKQGWHDAQHTCSKLVPQSGAKLLETAASVSKHVCVQRLCIARRLCALECWYPCVVTVHCCKHGPICYMAQHAVHTHLQSPQQGQQWLKTA